MTNFLRTWNLHQVLFDSLQCLRKFGLRRTLAVARSRFGDYAFDIRYGTDTVEPIELSQLDIPYESVRLGRRYQPTSVSAFKVIMEALEPPPGGVFVDFGSGKGRVLMLAAAYPFARIVGIEFSERLCAISKTNIEKFKAKETTAASFDIVHEDATRYTFKDDETVLYFYHPFGEEVFRRVLRNISESLKRRPRQAWLVYHLSDERARTEIEENSPFVLKTAREAVGYDYMLFTNARRLVAGV
jgi:SAM-dependent methyltransferase